jgi:hypothetical protein
MSIAWRRGSPDAARHPHDERCRVIGDHPLVMLFYRLDCGYEGIQLSAQLLGISPTGMSAGITGAPFSATERKLVREAVKCRSTYENVRPPHGREHHEINEC